MSQSPRIVLLTGPSGCGKTMLTKRLGLPVVALDNFYRDGDDPQLPNRFGIIDWDDPESWNGAEALATLKQLVSTGQAEIPIYSIPTNSRTGSHELGIGAAPLIIAEGIFAANLVAPLTEAGLLADAICLDRPRLTNFWFRLLRDLGEGRKSPGTLIRRGVGLMRDEPALIQKWVNLGCHLATPEQAEKEIRALA